MCGIFGAIGHHQRLKPELVDLLRHRGPDGSGFYQDPKKLVCFGHTRLSIIDLTNAGRQPMTDDSGRYVLTYNGEIYNYRDLRAQLTECGYHFATQSDTEVILYAFREWGTECLSRFRGMFAFGLYDRGATFGPDPKNKRYLPDTPYLFLARDRFGIKPLCYNKTNESVFFASELRFLLQAGLADFDLNRSALRDFFTFGSISGPRTVLAGVEQLPPAHFLVVNQT